MEIKYSYKGEVITEDQAWRQTYKSNCSHGTEVSLITQADENPEYYTGVYIQCNCGCGESIYFDLPAN